MTSNAKSAIVLAMKVSFVLGIILALSCCGKAEAKHCDKVPIKVAVIDTGFGYQDRGHDAPLCKYGHYDFSKEKQFSGAYDTRVPVPVDTHGHGTNIVGIINSYAKENHINYCIVVIKYYSERQTGHENLIAFIRAINYAANIKVDYVNYSGGGPESDRVEKASVKRFLNGGGKMIAAAGNEHANLNIKENAYYPAMYDKRIIVVGNLCKNGVRCESSNYGDAVTRWEVGEDVEAYGLTMTGTSQATAVATGKILSESSNRCDIGF